MGKRILLLLSIILVNIYYIICIEKSTKIIIKRDAEERKLRNLQDKTCENYIEVSFGGEEEVTYYGGYDSEECRTSISYIEFNGTIISDSSKEFSLSKAINLKYCFDSPVTSLENFFSEDCDENNYLIESIDLSHFDSKELIKINSMFSYCSSLKSINFNSFDTSSVFNMSELFLGCSSLESLTLTKFITSKVTDMSSMFKE